MKIRFIQSIFIGLLLYSNYTTFSMKVEAFVPRTKMNVAKDNTGIMPPIETSQLKITNRYEAPDGSIINRPLIKLVPDDQSPFILGKEMVQLGGGLDDKGQKLSTSLSVYGRPYSNYNAGCTLCIFSGGDSVYRGGGQAAISGLDYHGGASAVANGDMATVGFYHYDENSSGRIVAQAASFGPGVVTLSSPMTNEQISQLYQGMYIATNVIDPTIKNSNDLIRSHIYWGFIKSWDANHIYVYDWAALGGGNTTSGQIPDVKYLESHLSTYKVPMVFVGISGGILAENEYMVADGSRVLGDKATAIATNYEREEFNFRARNWTKPKSLTFRGWVTSFECRPNCDPNAVSEDSYAYVVNGPDGLPRAYVAQMMGDALEFSGYSTFIGGNGAPEHVDNNGNVSAGIVGSNHIMNSFASGLPNNAHISTIVQREKVINNDWRDYSIRFLMDVDSQRDRKKGLYGGSRMGSIVFNYNAAHYGGVCLLGYDTNVGLCQEGDGSVNFAKPVTMHEGARIDSNHLLSFQNSKKPDAVYLFTDENGDINIGTQIVNGGNIRQVNGYYGGSAILTNRVSAPKIIGTNFQGQLSTPSSSTAPCTAGEFKDDTNYHYVCVAANKWKRVALSDF